MSLNIELPITDDLRPSLLLQLESLKDGQLFHTEHNLRHPYAAYSISLGTIGERIKKVISIHEQALLRDFSVPGKLEFWPEMHDAIDHMLDSIMEHRDVCRNIVNSFFAPKGANSAKAINTFNKNSKIFTDHTGLVDNTLKHNQGLIAPYINFWQDKTVIGYFIDGPHEDGSRGPDKNVHARAKTFSLNRDIPYHVCTVYKIAEILSDTLKKFCPSFSPTKHSSLLNEEGRAWKDVIEKTANLQKIYFLWEKGLSVPLIAYKESSVKIAMPSLTKLIEFPPKGCGFLTQFSGDGVTNKFNF